ncbi:MAG: sulfurtransferase-like selenium metabolism protein YedF [bacterium]
MEPDHDFLLIVKSNLLGEGEPDLGEKLITAFFKMLLEAEGLPQTIIFMNSGVFLTTAGSPVLEEIKELEKRGASISSCGTCLDYYGRKDKLEAGVVGNMRQTVDALVSHKKAVTI